MKNIGKELKKLDIGKLASGNSLPLVLIGAGLGLFLFNKYKGGSSKSYAKYRYRRNLSGSEPHQTNEEKSAGISRKIGDSASAAYESASDAANKTIKSVRGAAGDAYGKIGEASGQLRERYDHHLKENPLIIGAVALAVGAAVGLAIPATHYESQLMGEARENLMTKAQTAAKGAFDKVQEVVGQAKDTIVEDAKQLVTQAQDSITENLKTENSEQKGKA